VAEGCGDTPRLSPQAGTLVEYGYNPTGTRRYASDATVGVENYFWPMRHVLADYNSSWSLTRSYILGPRVDEIIAMIDRAGDLNTAYWLMKNRLVSTHNAVASSETVMTAYDYGVWGDYCRSKCPPQPDLQQVQKSPEDDPYCCDKDRASPFIDWCCVAGHQCKASHEQCAKVDCDNWTYCKAWRYLCKNYYWVGPISDRMRADCGHIWPE